MPNQPPADAWSEARTHDQVTRYRRSGSFSGPAVLVLRDPADADCFWPELAELVGSCRVIAPEVTADDTNMVGWLTGFLEAIGTSAVSIVAAERYCLPATELALLEFDALRRLVIVAGRNAQPPVLDGVLTSRGGRVPLLILGRDLPPAHAMAAIGSFLAGEARGAG